MKNKKLNNNQRITLIARAVIYLMALAVISICAILLPELAREERVSNPNAGPALPFLIAAWILSLPIFAALYEALKITSYIEKNTAFSDLTVIATKKIKSYALLFSGMIIISSAVVVVVSKSVDPGEDVTPVFTFAFVFAFTSCVIAAFAAVLEKLLKEALDLKTENDSII